ncbi:MAG: SiaB family protein kinase [Bacteroidota bacterium]
MDLDIFDFYDKMEKSNIILSFKGEITSELLTSILQIMESKLENYQEAPKTKKKVYNVLVECLQNLYHHLDEVAADDQPTKIKTAIFMIAKDVDSYTVMTGNYILSNNIKPLAAKLDKINALSKDELRSYYQEILNNEEYSEKGGGGLGLIDIARRTGQKLGYNFKPIDDEFSFFSLDITIMHLLEPPKN